MSFLDKIKEKLHIGSFEVEGETVTLKRCSYDQRMELYAYSQEFGKEEGDETPFSLSERKAMYNFFKLALEYGSDVDDPEVRKFIATYVMDNIETRPKIVNMLFQVTLSGKEKKESQPEPDPAVQEVADENFLSPVSSDLA